MARRVLTDYTGLVHLQIVEGKDGGKLVVEGKVGHCDVPTANGRVYPRGIMEREISRLKPRIEQLSVMSAVDHPGDGKTRLKESGALVRDLWVEDNGEIFGRFEIVEEADAGRNLAAFLRRGAKVGMSSRGMGSTVPSSDGNDVVGEDYRLNTWDFVSDPACHDAYPALISEDEEDKVTEDYLRAKFPAIVQAIEEKAYATAQQVVEDDVQERVREEVQKDTEEALKIGRDRIREEVAVEVQEEGYQNLREDFAVRLVRAIAELRDGITEEVRSEMASDPEVAGAKSTLKKIAEMVNPFQPTTDTKKILGEKDSLAEDLRKEVADLKRLVQTEQEKVSKLDHTGRQLAYALYVEQSLTGRSDAESIKSMVGDLAKIESAEDLQQRVAAAVAEADKVRAGAEAEIESAKDEAVQRIQEAEARAAEAERRIKLAERTEARIQELVEERVAAVEQQITEVIAAKDAEIAEARNQIKESTAQSNKVALLAYAHERTIGHPKARQIVEAVANGEIADRDSVDRAATRLEESAHVPGGVRERVRRALSTGRETMTEDERRESDAAEMAALGEAGEAAADLHELGTSLVEQEGLAGVKHRLTDRR